MLLQVGDPNEREEFGIVHRSECAAGKVPINAVTTEVGTGTKMDALSANQAELPCSP